MAHSVKVVHRDISRRVISVLMFECLVSVRVVVIVEQLRYPVPHTGLFLFDYDNERLSDGSVCLMNLLNVEIISNEKPLVLIQT